MNQPWVFLLAAIAVLAVAVFLIVRGERSQREAGLPAGRVVYNDTSAWVKTEKPLYDPDWALAGKPDYLVVNGKETVPVEVKSCAANEPYPGHVLQLAAYCRLVQVQTGVRPKLGYLHYHNTTFEIEYTRELEIQLKQLVEEIRGTPVSSKTPRSHDQLARCRACGYREICEDRMQ